MDNKETITREECEMRITQKMREIIAIYHLYEPNGDYLSMWYTGDAEKGSFDPECPEKPYGVIVIGNNSGNEPVKPIDVFRHVPYFRNPLKKDEQEEGADDE